MGAKPFLDVREGRTVTPPRPTGARASLMRSLGRQGVLSVDPLTGTASAVQKLNGALTGRSSADRAGIAWRFVRSHAAALGLSAGDLGDFALADRQVSGRSLLTLRWSQSYRGIPTFDNDLRAAVDRSGRLIVLTGTPLHDLSVPSTTPTLSAAQALAAVGGARASRARLVIFGGDGAPRLAWHLTYRASSAATYDVVVDATSGRLLHRNNLTQFDSNASVWPNYPDAPSGGTQGTVDIAPYLTDTTRLAGPNAHVWDDLNDDDQAQVSEEVVPGSYTFVPFCAPATPPCAWNPNNSASWNDNHEQNATQLFWFVNNYHDQLAAPPIGFDQFHGAQALEVNADDGAATGPDAKHVNNANMTTPPAGSAPKMQMYLFSGPNYRAINGGDDAATVYHEYTHGLTARLITNNDGSQALGSPQSAAMSEGWSDWYAEDYLVHQGLETDTPATAGEIDIGRYSDLTPHTTRPQGLDCPLSPTDVPGCPSLSRHPGGYTLQDFGTIAAGGHTEVHADGVIWSQTLWDLRAALAGATCGIFNGDDVAKLLVTDALRISPPEPSFLDARNAILAAETGDCGGTLRDTIWQVFAARGMGFYAGDADASDTTPVEDFAMPPAPGDPKGSISGRVTSEDTGAPLHGVTVGVGGQSDSNATPALSTVTDASGDYTLTDVPAGPYAKLVAYPSAGSDQVVKGPVTVVDGQTANQDFSVRRDWAARAGGASIDSVSDDSGTPFGCGGNGLIDQHAGVGWSANNTGHPTIVVRLPQAVTVRAFVADPGNTCGDDAKATTKDYRIETSPDRDHWTVAKEGTFAPGDAHRSNTLAPTAGVNAVRFVRLTLLSPQNATSGFIDFSELEVLGWRTPFGHLTASASSVLAGTTVSFDAGSFTAPDAAIDNYEWDFDGNGTPDRTTPGPTTSFAYGAGGSYAPTVTVNDVRGGAGTASTVVDVIAPPSSGGPPKTTPPPPPAPAPKVTLSKTGTSGKVTVTITCSRACIATGQGTITATLARRYHLSRRTVAKLSATLRAAGTKHATLTITPRSTLRRLHVKRLPIAISVTAIDTGGGVGHATRTVTVKL